MHIYDECEIRLAKTLLQRMSSDYHLDDEVVGQCYLREIAACRQILQCLRTISLANDSVALLCLLDNLRTHTLAQIIYLVLEDNGCFVLRSYDYVTGSFGAEIWHPIACWYTTEVRGSSRTGADVGAETHCHKLIDIGVGGQLVICAGRRAEKSAYVQENYKLNTVDGNRLVDLLLEKEEILRVLEPKLRQR